MLDRRAVLQALAASLAVPAGSLGWAQAHKAWPQAQVNLIVPFPAGGPSAILAKHVAQSFERVTQQPMRLLYQNGAGGLQGANFVAKTEANGRHLLIGGSHLAVARALAVHDEFDWVEDLRPLALVAEVPMVLLVNPARMRARTTMEWQAELKRHPTRYRMATAGIGSSSHIAAETLRLHEGVRFEMVHFRGSGPALQDLLEGSVDMMLDGVVSSLPHIQSGKLKALVVSGKQRLTVLPDVPSVQEVGIEVLDSVPWYGLFAPVQLTPQQAAAMQSVFLKMEKDPVLMANLEAIGIRWGGVYGDDFQALVMQETVQWAQRVKQLGLKNMAPPHIEESGM